MKALIFGLGMFFALNISAQESMDANEIIRKINKGETVNLNGVKIVGDLDLTDLENREQERGNKDSYFSRVDVELIFVNCVFTDDVLAFYCKEYSEECYRADFNKSVTFIDCTFNGETSFKYSDFSGGVVFNKNTFTQEANFKYSKFKNEATFQGCRFREETNFKYAKFSGFVNFHEAEFMKEVSFKYSKFPEGAMFSDAHFHNEVDFKYTEFAGNVVFEGAQFDGEVDQKYSHILQNFR